MDNYGIHTLVDQHVDYEFYGVYNNYFKIGNLIFEAIEDPSDGYRSYLDSVDMITSDREAKLEEIKKFFPKNPIAKVKIVADKDWINIIDSRQGHLWLSIGTDHSDDYYPNFYFTYAPMALDTPYSEDIQDLSPELISAERFI